MGDITPVKILIVAVIALLVLGPDKLPEMMRKAGKAWADFRSFRETMTSQVRDTVGDVPGFSELTKLTQLTNVGLKSTIASTVTAAMSPTATSSPPGSATSTSMPGPAPVETIWGELEPTRAAVVTQAPAPSRPNGLPPGLADPIFAADDPSFN